MSMELYESKTHPFIIKLWLEETAEETSRATWRGHITHVPSGERRYLQELDEIITFIIPYLEQMGVETQRPRKVKRWLTQWVVWHK